MTEKIKRKYLNNLKHLSSKIIFFDKIKNKLSSSIMKSIKCELEQKYQDSYIIFSRNGVGDIFFVASLLKEFKKKHPGKIVYLTEKPRMKTFLQAFSSIDEIVVDEEFKIFQSAIICQKEIRKGKVNLLFFPYRGGKKNYVFADSYTNLLDLDYNVKRELPCISPDNINNANNEFLKLGLNPNKTVILIPEAVMFDYRVLAPKFWMWLADELTKIGYDVIFNSSNKAYKNYKTTFLPLVDFLCFAKQSKHVISFRSGICDVLVGIGLNNITTIYPPNLEVIWANKFLFDDTLNKYHEKKFDTEFENIFNIYALNSNFKRNDISEIIYENNEKELLDALIFNVNNSNQKVESRI